MSNITRADLCRALARHAHVIPMEVARAVVTELCGPASPIDVDKLKPTTWGDYTIRAVRLGDVLLDLHGLHQRHWMETEAHRHGLAMDPDYQAMLARDDAGQCLQLVVQHGQDIVGHLRLWVFPRSLHTSTPFAEEDTLYLLPQHRGGFLAMHLLRYAERCLLGLGVREIRANSKLANKADVLMRRLRYQEVAIQFVKIIGEGEPHVR